MITEELTRQTIGNPKILLAAHRPLRIHGILFFIYVNGIQQRIGKEAGKSVHALGERVVLDRHHVIGDIERGVGIGHTTVLRGECHESVGLGKLCGTHKQHMLEVMRHARIILRV